MSDDKIADAFMAPLNGGKFEWNYEFTAYCLEQTKVEIDGPNPKNYDCYTVTIKVGPEVYVETSRSPYTAMAYALEALAKRLKGAIPEKL